MGKKRQVSSLHGPKLCNMVYMDLHLHWPVESEKAQALLSEARRLGFAGACLTRTGLADQPLPRARAVASAPQAVAGRQATACLAVEGSPGGRPVFASLTRLTAEVARPEQQFGLNSASGVAADYDVLACKPCSFEMFRLCCTRVSCDLIVLDLARRVPWHDQAVRAREIVEGAVSRGLHFELSFAPCLRDPRSKRQFLHSAKLLLGATKGRNLLLTSGAAEPLQLRSPYDAINLALFLGLSPKQARMAVAEAPGKVLQHARQRQNSSAGRLPVTVAAAAVTATGPAGVAGTGGRSAKNSNLPTT